MLDDFTERRPYNAVSDFVDSHIAQGRAGKIAFIDPQRSLTYGDLQARSIRFANGLRALGLEHEDRVALLMHDTVDYPVAFWGAIRAGSIAIPLNTFLNPPQYAYMLADSRAVALVLAASLVPTIAPVLEKLPCLKTVIVVGGDGTQDLRRPRRASLRRPDRGGQRANPTPRPPSPTKWRSGSTPPARPASPRASSTSTPT